MLDDTVEPNERCWVINVGEQIADVAKPSQSVFVPRARSSLGIVVVIGAPIEKTRNGCCRHGCWWVYVASWWLEGDLSRGRVLFGQQQHAAAART